MQCCYYDTILPVLILISVLFNALQAQQLEEKDENALPEISLPQKCMISSRLLIKQCCMFAPFFYGEITRSCGAVVSVRQTYSENKVVVLKSQTPADNCKYWRCVLKKYDILDLEGNVDEDKWQMHLSRWLQRNPLFHKVIESAKSVCVQQYAVFFPLETCDFFKYIDCYRSHVNVHCPVTINTPDCQALKEFYEECGKYYEMMA